MVGKDLEKNLNLSLKLHSEMEKPLNYSLRKGAVSIDSLDKLWGRRTSVPGKSTGVGRLKSDTRPITRASLARARSYRPPL